MTNGMLRDEIELEKSEMKRREDELAMKVSCITRENDLWLRGNCKIRRYQIQSIEIKDSMGKSHVMSRWLTGIFSKNYEPWTNKYH